MRIAGLLLVLGSMAFMAACGSSGGSTSSITQVQVTCSPTTVLSGQTSQCTATVTGTANFSTAVTWSASAGTVTNTGLFTAPVVMASTQVGVSATSTQDTTKSGSATVTVNPALVNNVQPIAVNSGPEPQTFFAVNEAFITVTICVPGTATCQTIPNVLVDTGSTGLRLLSSVVTIPLPQQKDSSGNTLGECTQFADGFTWGTVNVTNLSIAGESATGFPMQLILPSSGSPAVPSTCSGNAMGPNEGDSVQALGANGILGVGFFLQDCGLACVQNPTPPDVYYDCPASGCTPTYVALGLQVVNPVSLFGADSNGVLVQLPTVPDGGVPTAAGSLIFGIGTQSNNALGSAMIYTVNDQGDFTTMYNGQSYPASFVDSGSNGIFFLDSNTTGMPVCPSPNASWYCPNPSPKNFMATNQGANGTNAPVSFSIENAVTLFNGSNTAFSTLGGPNPGAFDWGLPFFYGRNVFFAIQGLGTPAGPYVAY